MRVDRREWLETVIEACTRVIEDGVRSDDPWLPMIVDDATALRERLEIELAGLDPGETT